MVLAVFDLEEELAQEGLVVLLAQHLVALGKVIAFLHFETFQRLDQLHGVLAPAEGGLLHSELEGIHGLVVRLHVAVRQRARRIDLLEPGDSLIEELLVRWRIEHPFQHRDIAVDADKTLDLVAEAGKIGGLGDGAVSGPLVLLRQAEIVGLVADRDSVASEEDAEQAIEVSADLGKKRGHVGAAERDARSADHLAARLLDLVSVSIARGLTPGIIGIGDMPLLAHFVDEIGRKGDGLGGGIIERAEGIAVALARGDGRVEAHTDHVDDLLLGKHRHAGETDVGKKTALVRVDLVLDHQLLRLAAPHIGLGFVVRHDELDRPAVDAT